MKMEVEIGVMMPQAVECLGLPEARRSKGGSCPRGSGETVALPAPDFRFLAFRTMREYISVVLMIQFVALCYNNPRKLIQTPKPR